MKKKCRIAAAAKRTRSGSNGAYPDRDPEWEHLEERYSQINDEMRELAKLLSLQ